MATSTFPGEKVSRRYLAFEFPSLSFFYEMVHIFFRSIFLYIFLALLESCHIIVNDGVLTGLKSHLLLAS